jgi:hypothetical protein
VTNDNKPPREPFRIVTERDEVTPAVPLTIPRLGPTMAQICARLEVAEKLEPLVAQVLKRLQQTALMVDGLGSNLNRRIDLLHTEAALTRAAVGSPSDEPPVSVVVPASVKARRAVVSFGKYASYATTAAVILRLIAKAYPEYEEAIDALLKLGGL